MKYGNIIELKDEEFRRLTGVKKLTYNRMVEILEDTEEEKKKFGGKPNKVPIYDRLLMTLESSQGIQNILSYILILWNFREFLLSEYEMG